MFCDVILAGLAGLRLLRRRGVVVGLACGFWLLEVAVALWGPTNNLRYSFGPFTLTPIFLFGIVTLTPVFLPSWDSSLSLPRQGVGFWLARPRVPRRVRSGRLAAVLWSRSKSPLAAMNLPGSTSVMAPALAYPLLWLGIHLPSPIQENWGHAMMIRMGCTSTAGPLSNSSRSGASSIGGTWCSPFQGLQVR